MFIPRSLSIRWAPGLLVLLLVLWPIPLWGQYCELAFEEFPFSGPSDFDNGTFRVEWCANGATVTSSNFCPTGESFKMAGESHDPVIWVYVDAQSCTAVRLEFDYGQFFDTLTQVRYAVSSDTTLDCGAAILTSAGFLTQTGGICTPAQLTIPLSGGQSVYFQFDHGPTTDSVFLDNVSIQLETCDCEGGSSDHGPCETGGPGCNDPVIEACVCALDDYCCSTAWDETCVAEVESFGCGDCGGGPSCAAAFSTGFGTYFQSGTVCELWPDLFETCEGSGPWITSSGDCGGSGDYVMHYATGFPYSSATTICVDLSAVAEASLRFDYSKDGGTLGPRVEASIGGGSFTTLWDAPTAFPGGCTAECVDLESLVGEPEVRFRFSSGSSTSNGASFDNIEMLPGTGCPACTDPTADAGPDALLRADGFVVLQGLASGGSGGSCPADYQPSWSGPGIVSGADTLGPTVDQAGTYALTVSCGDCQSSDTVTVHNETVSTALICQPPSGTVPFATRMSVWLTNNYGGQTRTVAGRLHVQLGGGQSYSNWRTGRTNIGPGDTFSAAWNQGIPALGLVIGENIFRLEAEDITAAPYNQPPYPPAGSTATDTCTVTAAAP